MEKIAVVGSSGHSKVIIDIIEKEGKYQIAGLIDNTLAAGSQIMGYDLLGKDEDLLYITKKHSLQGLIIAIGDNFIRARVANRIATSCPELAFVSAIHPDATISRDVEVGKGSVIMAGAVVCAAATVGRFCIINTNSSLDHDSKMGDFSSLAPGATTGGNCSIGAFSAIGIGATIIHGISVGEHSIVGAGATVLKDVSSHVVAFGSPTKVMRKRTEGEKYL